MKIFNYIYKKRIIFLFFFIGVILSLTIIWLIYHTSTDKINMQLPSDIRALVAIDSVQVLENMLEKLDTIEPLEVGTEEEIVCNGNCYIILISDHLVKYFALEYKTKLFDLKTGMFILNSEPNYTILKNYFLIFYNLKLHPQKIINDQPAGIIKKLDKAIGLAGKNDSKSSPSYLFDAIITFFITLIATLIGVRYQFYLQRRSHATN